MMRKINKKKMKNNKVWLTLTALPLPALALISATDTDNKNNEKNTSGLYGFHNANDILKRTQGKNEVYGYGVYNDFSALSAKYNLDNLQNLPYNDTRTWIGSSKAIDGSQFSSFKNGDANLFEKGLMAMGIKTASKPDGRYDLNTSSFIVSPFNNKNKFDVFARNILNQLLKIKRDFDGDSNLLNEYQNAKSGAKKFIYDLYLTTRDTIENVVKKQTLSGKPINLGEMKLGYSVSFIPTYRKFNFENETVGWIQSLAFSLKNYNLEKLDDNLKMKNLEWYKLTVIDYDVNEYLENVSDYQEVFSSKEFNNPNFKSVSDNYLSVFNTLLSQAIRQEGKNKLLSFLIPSNNPLIVDYNPSFKAELIKYLVSWGGINLDGLSVSDGNPNPTIGTSAANVLGDIIYNYLKKQAAISNRSVEELFAYNQSLFGDVIKGSIIDDKLNVPKLKEALANTQLSISNTIINDKSDLLKQIANSKAELYKNFDNKLSVLSQEEKDDLRFDYYQAIDNKIDTESKMFNFISQLDININNYDEYKKYTALQSNLNRLNETQLKELEVLKLKFESITRSVSLKEYLTNISIINNFHNEDIKNLINQLPNQATFLDVYLTIQKMYGLKDHEIFNQLPTDMFIFSQSIDDKIDEISEKIKELVNQSKIVFDKEGQTPASISTLINRYEKQKNQYENLLNATDTFSNLLFNLDISKNDINEKIREWNVNSTNIKNNLSLMVNNAVTGFDLMTNGINDVIMKNMISKGYSEFNALDVAKFGFRYYISYYKMLGLTLLNAISFNFGSAYNDIKAEVEKNKAKDEVDKAKGFTLSSFFKLQSDIDTIKLVSKSMFIANLAQKILYLHALLSQNQIVEIKANADFKEIYNLFINGRVDEVNNINIDDAPDYLISQVINNMVIAIKNNIEKDVETNVLIHANSDDDLEYIGQYVSQAIALNYNFNKALGVDFKADPNYQAFQEVVETIEKLNQEYLDNSNNQTANDVISDVNKTFRLNIFNIPSVRQNMNSLDELTDDFKQRLSAYLSVFKDVKADYQTSELCNQLIDYQNNKDNFNNLNNEEWIERVKTTFFNDCDDNTLDNLLTLIRTYLINASFIDEMNQSINQTNNQFNNKVTYLEKLNYSNSQIRSYFENNSDVAKNYVDKFSAFIQKHSADINKESSKGINASDRFIDSFKEPIVEMLNTYYHQDGNYAVEVADRYTLDYEIGENKNFGWKTDGMVTFDDVIENYTKVNDITFINDITKDSSFVKESVQDWKQKAAQGYQSLNKWWSNNMPKNLATKAYFSYKFVGVPVYSQIKYGNFLTTIKNQLLHKEIKKVTNLAKKAGNKVSYDVIKKALETGDVAKLQNILKGGDKVKFSIRRPFSSLYQKFNQSRIVGKADALANKAVRNYSHLAHFDQIDDGLKAIGQAKNIEKVKFATSYDQTFAIMTKHPGANTFDKAMTGLWNQTKSLAGKGANRSAIFKTIATNPNVNKTLLANLDNTFYKSLTYKRALKALEKVNKAKIPAALKEIKAAKIMAKVSKSGALKAALYGKKAVRFAKLAKVGKFFKNIGKLVFGSIKTNPIGFIISIAIDSLINFLTFDTTKGAGYWIPLNAKELDNIHTELDYNNTSIAIAKAFNDKFVNPIKITAMNYPNLNYIKELALNEEFAIEEAKRLLNDKSKDSDNYKTIGTKEYTFLYYLQDTAKNQLLNLNPKKPGENYSHNISSHQYQNGAIYYDNLDQALYNSNEFSVQDRTHNFANYINRTNLIDLNVDFDTFVNNPFTEYIDISALNNLNGSMFVSDNNMYGAFNGFVKLPISSLLSGGLTSLVIYGNQARSSFNQSNEQIKNLLENAPTYRSLLKNISGGVSHSNALTNAEQAANKNARWYSLIPFVGAAIAESQRDGTKVFDIDNEPNAQAFPYIPSDIAYQILQSANGNGEFKQNLYAYSSITVKLVRLNNGNLGLSVVQGVYDNSSASYAYKNQNVNVKILNSFNGAILVNEKELNKDFFKNAIQAIDKFNIDKVNQSVYLDVNSDLTESSNLDGINLLEAANKQLIISHNDPENSSNFFVKSYVARLKNNLNRVLGEVTLPKSVISNQVINQQLNESQKQLLKNITISKIDFVPFFNQNNQLKLKIRYDVTFNNTRFNKKANPVVSFMVNNQIYKNKDFINSKNDLLNAKAINVNENIGSKMKAILGDVLKIKEYSALKQANYNLSALYEKSIFVDTESLKRLEDAYLKQITDAYNKEINDKKFNYLFDAFAGDWLGQANFSKEYSQGDNPSQVLVKYYDKLLLDDRIILENQINQDIFNIPTPQQQFDESYKNNTSLYNDEEKMKFLALKLDLVYYQKRVYQNYDELERALNRSDMEFNIALTNPFSFKIFTNKQINLNNGGKITFVDNFNRQSYKQVNVKNNEVIFAYDLNNFDNQERIYYNEYTNQYIENPYQLKFNLVDENNRNVNITINFKLPDLKQSDIAFRQQLDNNIKSVYTSKYINLKALPFAKNLNNLTLDDVNTLIKNNQLSLAFGDDKDALAVNWIKQDKLLSQEQRENQLQLFENQKQLKDNDRFIGFIAQNPFRVFKSTIEQANNMVNGSYTLNANKKINELFYDGNNIEYININNPFNAIDISYLFNNSKLLNINNLAQGTKITWFKTDDGNKASSKVETVFENNGQAIINFSKNSPDDYSGLYKLSFLVPTQTINNQRSYFKFNKLIFISKNKANDIKENVIKNEINSYFKTKNSTHYLIDLDDSNYYQSISPFINKLNKSGNQINAVVFNQLYQDYIYSKNKYLVNSLKYKNITQKVKEQLQSIDDERFRIPQSLDEYITQLSSKVDNNKQLINELNDQININKGQLLTLQNDSKNNQVILHELSDKKDKIIALLSKNHNEFTYEEFNEAIKITPIEFRKLQVKQWLYKQDFDKTLKITKELINQLNNFINNGGNLPEIPETGYNASDLNNARSEYYLHLNIKENKQQKIEFNNYMNNLSQTLNNFEIHKDTLLEQFINDHFTEEKLKEQLSYIDSSYQTVRTGEYQSDFENPENISNIKLYQYNLTDKAFIVKEANPKSLKTLPTALALYVSYEKDGQKKLHQLSVIKKDKLVNWITFTQREDNFNIKFSVRQHDNILIENLKTSNINEDVKAVIFEELQSKGIISFINNTISFNDIDEIKTLTEQAKNKQDISYFELSKANDTYNKTTNDEKQTLFAAYQVLTSLLFNNFDTLIKQNLNRVNNQIEANNQTDYESSINEITKKIEQLNSQLKDVQIQGQLPIKQWLEQLLFSYNINIIDYIEAVKNQEFNNNTEYLNWLNEYIKDLSLPYIKNVINAALRVEKYIQELFDINETILVNKTTDSVAFEYLVNKLTPIISNQDGVHIEKINELLEINNITPNLIFTQPDWKIKGLISQINMDENNNFVVLQLLARFENQVQVIMMKLSYDKDIEYYVITDLDDVIDVNKGEWLRNVKWNEANANIYASFENNPNYILKTQALNNRFKIKDENIVSQHKIIKNNILNNLDLFNNIITLRQFNTLFKSSILNDLGDYNNLLDLRFKITEKTLEDNDQYRLNEYTLINAQYKIIINVNMLKNTNHANQVAPSIKIYEKDNLIYQSNNVNSVSYENIKISKDIENLVNITKDNDGLHLIRDIILKNKTSIILNATQFKLFLETNNLTFKSSLDNDSFFKNVDLVDASGNFKPYIYQISLANANPDLDITESKALGLLLVNLKISIFDEYKKQYVSSPFNIIIEKQENNYDKTIKNNIDNIIINQNDIVKNNLTNTLKDIINEVNKEYLYFQSKYLQSIYFEDSKKLNLKSAIFYALNTYEWINPIFSDINNDKHNLDDKVNYIYQYIINHYSIPQGDNENETFNQIIQLLLDNYLFNDQQLEDEVDKFGKVIKSKPELVKNKIYMYNHYQFSKVINYRDIAFTLTFNDKDDGNKRLLLQEDIQLIENGQPVDNPFKNYFLEYNNSNKYITFKTIKLDNEIKIQMITTTNPSQFNLSDLLLEEEKSLDRDITNQLIISRLVEVEKLIQNLIELQSVKINVNKNKDNNTITITRLADSNEFSIDLLAHYNKDLSKSILNKDNMFMAKNQVMNITELESINKLINDKDYIISLTNINSDSYLHLLKTNEYHLRLLEVVEQDDIVSYIYEIAFDNDKLENIKLQLNFINNEYHRQNLNKGSFKDQDYVNNLDYHITWKEFKENNLIKLDNQKVKLINKQSHLNIVKPFYSIESVQKDKNGNIILPNEQGNKKTWLPYLLGFSGILTVGISVLIYVIIKRKRTKTNFKA